MRRTLYSLVIIFVSLLGVIQIPAQSNSTSISATNISTATASGDQSASSTPADGDSSSTPMQSDDFLIDGVSYAKVLFIEGNVWIRPPGAMTFHRLAEDEPIAVQSVIYTGFNGTLDFATGPGIAVRMVPGTLVTVDQLPQPPPPVPPVATTPSTPAPEASQVAVRKGTVFSALGREDGQPIDFKVRTPEGVAGARGTMFSTSTNKGQSEVDMLHGTVNFETPDHQTSQIAAGESQQISGSAWQGGKYQLGQHQALNPANSDTFFNHAGGLLEHASGYGVVRRGLGPDIARTLGERGFKWAPAIRQRFQNAAQIHFKNRPVFNRMHGARAAGTGAGARTTTPQANHPFAPKNNPSSAEEKQRAERRRGAGERRDKDIGP